MNVLFKSYLILSDELEAEINFVGKKGRKTVRARRLPYFSKAIWKRQNSLARQLFFLGKTLTGMFLLGKYYQTVPVLV